MSSVFYWLPLTLGPLQLSCNPQWPVLVSCDEWGYWCPGPALSPHLSGPAAPREHKSSSLSNENSIWISPTVKQTAKELLVPKVYLATFDVFRAGSDVHGHSHDNLQPGLDCTCPPQWHACVSSELRLLEAVQLLLSIRQALLCEAVRVWIGQEKLWCGIQEGFRVRGIRKSKKWLIWRQINIRIRGYLQENHLHISV